MLTVLVVIFLGSLSFLVSTFVKSKVPTTDSPQNKANVESNSNGASSEKENNSSTAISSEQKAAAQQDFNQGIVFFDKSDFKSAIDQFAKAININSQEPTFFSKKAQSQNNLGLQQEAVTTVEDGLKTNPDSDLLKTQLDILQKQWQGSQQQ